MYKPSEIANFTMLSSYLRTTPILMDRFINAPKIILDWLSDKPLKGISDKVRDSVIIEKFYIPKKNKKLGYRIVYKLKNQFSTDILKVLKFNLNNIYEPEDCVQGFVRGRNTRTNAQLHLGNKFLLKLDIKNFFESISISSVEKAFLFLDFNMEVAVHLSEICTLNGKLVQGYPTSPILANIVCCELDKKIDLLCAKFNATYSRYADDISISSNLSCPPIEEIEDILSGYDFGLNKLKTQKFKRGQNQYVTGLSITDNKYPRIPKPIKRKLRQKLYYLKLYGYHSHICHINKWDEKTDNSLTNDEAYKLKNYLKGWIDYINPIEPELAKKFYEIFNHIEQIEFNKRKKEFAKYKAENGGVIVFKP